MHRLSLCTDSPPSRQRFLACGAHDDDHLRLLTIDLPADLHSLVSDTADRQHKTPSQVIVELVQLGLEPVDADVSASSRLPMIRVSRPITAEDVCSVGSGMSLCPRVYYFDAYAVEVGDVSCDHCHLLC